MSSSNQFPIILNKALLRNLVVVLPGVECVPSAWKSGKIVLYSLVNILPLISAVRVLAIVPVSSRSRFAFNNAVMKSLHAAGHHITMISAVFSKNEFENFTIVNWKPNTSFDTKQITLPRIFNISPYKFLDICLSLEKNSCNGIMKLEVIQDALNSEEKLYDVMFIDLLIAYRCYMYVAQKLDIPVIGIVTPMTWTFVEFDMNYPNSPAAIRFEFFNFPLKMTFFQRVKNLWSRLIIYYFYYYRVPAQLNQFVQEHFPDMKSSSQSEISLIFHNSHASIFPRQGVQNVVEIGGVHITPANLIPQDLQKFIEEADNGVILFTFGSVIRGNSIPDRLRDLFLKAFSKIPQRVIWKYEGSVEGISDNVLLSTWVPQRDILEHRNVKAFISHCGLSGIYEAIYTGTPLVAIPIFFDQYANAARLEELGVAVSLSIEAVTLETILDVLNKIINDTGYRERMKSFSQIFKDRPMTPQQSVVYWTEYVINHKGASHLKAVGIDTPFYQYWFLDVAFFLIITVSVFLYIIIFLLKALNRIFIGIFRSQKLIEKKKIH